MHRVVIDYGHGGEKSGAVYGDAMEKDLALSTGRKIYEALHFLEAGRKIEVLLTRDADYDVPIAVRCELINAHHAQKPIELSTSIHYNAAQTPSASGFEVYYAANSKKGMSAAGHIAESVRLAGVALRGNGAKTTEQLGRRLAMIHDPIPPAVLIEVGYLSNEKDRLRALTPASREQTARAIAEGIWKYLEENFKS